MFEKIKLEPRIWFLLGGISCFAMLGVGAYFQLVMNLAPCPLCISQRIAILVLGLVFLLAAIHNPKQRGIKTYAILGALVAVAGGSISARHVWIQQLPPNEVPECGPGLSYVFENFPLTETLKLMLSGTGECAKVDWSLFGISIPGWTLLAFIGLALLSLLQYWNVKADLFFD
jgi:disulfide bond formation protein DsbB